MLLTLAKYIQDQLTAQEDCTVSELVINGLICETGALAIQGADTQTEIFQPRSLLEIDLDTGL